MKIRVAVLDDAPALGRVMVGAFLVAHRGQMPEAAWRSDAASGRRRSLPRLGRGSSPRDRAHDGGDDGRHVLLVADDEADGLVALALGPVRMNPLAIPPNLRPSTCCRNGRAKA